MKKCCIKVALFIFFLCGITQILSDIFKPKWYGQKPGYEAVTDMSLGFYEKEERIRKYISVLCTFLLVNFAWIFFRAEDISMAFGIITRIFTDGDIWSLVDGTLYTVGLDQKEIMVLLIALIAIWKIELHGDVEVLAHRVSESHIIIRWGFIYLLIIGIMIFGIYGMGYNATNFIYSNF